MASGDGWVCTANTPSNPDISGIGVVSAFMTQAILSNLLGWYMYLFYPSSSSTSSSPRAPKFIHRLRAHVPTPVLKDLILLASDTQSLTGISLLIASFTQSMAAYHSVIVLNISWTSSLSHHLAILYAFPAFSSLPSLSSSHPGSRRWRGKRKRERAMRGIRLGVMAVYVLLHISFCARTYTHVRTYWSEECFTTCRTCSGSRGEMSEVLSWIVAGAATFLLGYVPFLISLLRRGREARAGPGSGGCAVAVAVARRMYEVVISVPASLAVMSFWTAFSVFGISRYRAGGGVGEEERWGFGQVLAVVGLGVVVFEGVKGFCGYGGGEDEQDDGEEGRTRRGNGVCDCGRRVTFDVHGGAATLEAVEVLVEEGK